MLHGLFLAAAMTLGQMPGNTTIIYQEIIVNPVYQNYDYGYDYGYGYGLGLGYYGGGYGVYAPGLVRRYTPPPLPKNYFNHTQPGRAQAMPRGRHR